MSSECRDDVLTAVSRAEQLWADALDARETANALSDRAEEEAEAAMELTENVAALYKSMKSISLEKIAKADAATTSSIDANGMVGRALEACQKADLLELQAEEALLLSEEKLTQHLLDFPDSSLAE
ncbi:hypothetical protein MPSEU_001000400 [Mayamaea pseudoterrestris]|nr:hypothetical protein MPSEU_001000400 [Mayamaea pseudoterrestris]